MFVHDSSHFTTDKFEEIRREHEPIGYATEAGLLYHLGTLCPSCWAALRELRPVEQQQLKATEVPVVLALRALTSPPEDLLARDASYRAAVAEAGERPLGFCFLLLEEVRNAAPARPRFAVKHLRSRAGAIGGNGVLLVHVREAHDLQARYLSILAGTLGRAEESVQGWEALALARFHLDRGSGRAELRAGCLEAEATLAGAENRNDEARVLLERAAALLAEYQPADRRAETLLQLGDILHGPGSGNRAHAGDVYQEALAILDGLEPGTNPLLRLFLVRELVGVLLEDNLTRPLSGPVKGRRAALREAERQLLESEALYRDWAVPAICAERIGYLGLLGLEKDYEQATAWLRQASARFCELDAVDSAVDLMLRVTLRWEPDDRPGELGPLVTRTCEDVWRFKEDEKFWLKVQVRLLEGVTQHSREIMPADVFEALGMELEKLKALQARADW